MNKAIAAVMIFGFAISGAPPVEAAGCIKGAIVGGLAAHFTHHNGVVGALGGCVVGRVISHFTGSETYEDVTGPMLGSDTDLGKIANDPKVKIVRASGLKGYKPNDAALQSRINFSSAVKRLDSEIASNSNLNSALQSAGFAATDVLAVSAKDGGTIFVNA
jgi:hypothetical protein